MNKRVKTILVAGARPNFMKIAPIMAATKDREFARFQPLLVHTGQHYDPQMSQVFFDQLDIPKPDINLGVGSDTHARQTAAIMIRFEEMLLKERPDLIIVVGDVNSTIACSLVAAKLHIKIAHVEAGLRSRNWNMPEEINRVLTDRLSDFLFTTSKDADENLRQEGIEQEKIFFVGNVMIDTLLRNIEKAEASTILKDLRLRSREYSVLTLHRPSNVDTRDDLAHLFEIFAQIQNKIPIVYPAHPRTVKTIEQFGLKERLAAMPGFRMTEPLGYLDFLKLMKNARFIMTDSGGIQEETTILGIPCLTLRNETERPVTITNGTNILVKKDEKKILGAMDTILAGRFSAGKKPEKWDGRAAQRILRILNKNL